MDYIEGMGNPNEYLKQLETCPMIGFPTPPFEVFRAWKPERNIDLLLQMRSFIYANQPVTVRNCYYHFEKELLAINAPRAVANLSAEELRETYLKNYHLTIRLLTKARLSGFIKCDWIVDDTREPLKTSSWSNINEILRAAAIQYRSDWQRNQAKYVEVWLEKRSLVRIFYPITDSYDVSLVPGGGYQSTDAIDDAAVRIRPRIRNNQEIVILYFGDLNPSGKDMPRDIKARLAEKGINVTLKEVALNQDDVFAYNLPRNPTKKNDSRCKWFKDKYPDVTYSVELDALEPSVLRQKIKDAIQGELDINEILRCKAIDDQERQKAFERLGITLD